MNDAEADAGAARAKGSAARAPCVLAWIGRRRYEPVHELQRELVRARAEGRSGDVIVLVEHEPVITLGRGADPANVVASADALSSLGVEVVATGRGGDVTYHGPGQLVAYPILDLRPDRCDVRKYVRALAEVMIALARENHVEAGVVDGLVGVWVDRDAPTEWAGAPWARTLAKLGAIGVRLSRWITMHGFALNLSVDLDHFQWIIPCGIHEHAVTSIRELTGRAPEVAKAALSSGPFFERALDLRVGAALDLSTATNVGEALLDASADLRRRASAPSAGP